MGGMGMGIGGDGRRESKLSSSAPAFKMEWGNAKKEAEKVDSKQGA